MNIRIPSEAALLALAEEAEREGVSFDPSHKPPPPRSGKGGPSLDDEGWQPPLTPTGEELYYCNVPYMLAHGERGGGKTIACGHRLFKHAYEYAGAAICVTTLTRSSATLGGAWTKLQTIVLPVWQDGIGMEGEGKGGQVIFKMDDSRNRYFWLRTEDGGWSMFFLRSMMHGEHIQSRLKGMEFTGFFFDELTEADDDGYFSHPIQQLGRIPGIPNQFYLGACNPSEDGEDHWVYQRFMTGFDNPAEKRPKRRADYRTFHFPMTENDFMTPAEKEAYLDKVYEACRTDPTAEDRLLKGIWRKKAADKGIFREYFKRELHLRGNVEKNTVIIPQGRVIDVGYDIGTANSSITFLQRYRTQSGWGWAVLDEIVLTGKYVPIDQIAPKLLGLMNYWCERTGTQFRFNHISDAAAFDQMRPDGSYDARALEKAVWRELETHAAKYPALRHLVRRERDAEGKEKPDGKVVAVEFELIPCPKPNGSVPARVKMCITLLQGNDLVVSAKAMRHVEMLETLEPDGAKGIFHPKKTDAGHIHVFDSMSYPIYHYEMGGTAGGVMTGPAANWVDLKV